MLFAFVTGKTGEDWCYGFEEAVLAKTQLGQEILTEFDSLIDFRDGQPCNCIAPNWKTFLEIYLTAMPSAEMVKLMVRRIKRYCKLNKIKYIQSKIVRTSTEVIVEEFPC